ncbi:MAG TPA: hypothetical protein VF223_12635, partial [Trebonia sp.]
MALLTKVGTFAKPTSDGAQSITGVGFQPKALLLWSVGTSADSTWRRHYHGMLGFGAGSSQGRLTAMSSEDGVSPSDTNRKQSTDIASFITTAALFEEQGFADLVSFDADGFTLSWTGTTAAEFDLHYLAIGGDAVVAAADVAWRPRTTNGTETVEFGFEPDLVLLMSSRQAINPEVTGSNFQAIGAVSSDGSQWSYAIAADDNTSAANTSRSQRTDAALYVHQTNGDHAFTLTLNSFLPNGIRFNVARGNSTLYYVMALGIQLAGSYSATVGSFTKASTTGTQAITGLGFQPDALILGGWNDDAGATFRDSVHRSFSLVTASDQVATFHHDVDGANPTNVQSYREAGAAYIKGSTAGAASVVARASLESLDADGFVLNWAANDSAADRVLYVALGHLVQPTVVDGRAAVGPSAAARAIIPLHGRAVSGPDAAASLLLGALLSGEAVIGPLAEAAAVGVVGVSGRGTIGPAAEASALLGLLLSGRAVIGPGAGGAIQVGPHTLVAGRAVIGPDGALSRIVVPIHGRAAAGPAATIGIIPMRLGGRAVIGPSIAITYAGP